MDEIDNLMKVQVKLYKDLLEVSRKMFKSLTPAVNTDSLQESLNEREIILDSIKDVEKKVKSTGREITEDYDLLAEVDSLLEEINEIDMKCAEILQDDRNGVSDEMKKQQTTGKAIKGYNRKESDGKGGFGRFIDLKK